MKNKEKFADCVLNFACDGDTFGVCEKAGKIERCTQIQCTKCLFSGMEGSCATNRRKWLESEYIEKPVISKRDRAFLEYLRDNFKTIARDENGTICVFTGIAEKE